jgi:hypothetical protein
MEFYRGRLLVSESDRFPALMARGPLTLIQPSGRYWPFQGIETGIYSLLAATLIAVTFVIVRRRDT